jgi:hypothetical protein
MPRVMVAAVSMPVAVSSGRTSYFAAEQVAAVVCSDRASSRDIERSGSGSESSMHGTEGAV